MTGQTASEPSRGRRAAILFAVVVALIALDLWSKAAIWTWLLPLQDMGELPTDGHGHQRWPLVGEWFAFMLNENYGAAFGQLDNIPYLLVSGRVLAVVLLAALIWRAPFGQRAYVTALVLILSGALGNLYDNLFKPLTPLPGKPFGPVRDFIDVYFHIPALDLDWHFPTFNVADSCITCGAVLLLLSGLLPAPAPPELDDSEQRGDGAPALPGTGTGGDGPATATSEVP